MGECWNCNATADDDWSCQACRTERELAESLAAADREIERLRAEIEVTKAALDDAWVERDFALGDAARLQALIDVYAEAWLERVHAYSAREWGHGTDERCQAADMALDAADDALRAAATKGTADGR